MYACVFHHKNFKWLLLLNAKECEEEQKCPPVPPTIDNKVTALRVVLRFEWRREGAWPEHAAPTLCPSSPRSSEVWEGDVEELGLGKDPHTLGDLGGTHMPSAGRRLRSDWRRC